MASPQQSTFVYILRCSDGSYYTGIRDRSVEERLNEHNSGLIEGYTRKRRPVHLVWSQEFQWKKDAIAAERQIKNWSRRKKIALINQDWKELKEAAEKDFTSGEMGK